MEHKTTFDNFIVPQTGFDVLKLKCFSRPTIDALYDYNSNESIYVFTGFQYDKVRDACSSLDITVYSFEGAGGAGGAWAFVFDLSMEPLEINAYVIKPLMLKEYLIQHIKRTKTPVCNKHLLYLDQANIHDPVKKSATNP